jgi:hypothetical protein
MSLTRRGFLGSLATFAAGLTLDPERLLWVPGEKTVFLAPETGWVDGGKVTTEWMAREAARLLKRHLTRVTRVEHGEVVGITRWTPGGLSQLTHVDFCLDPNTTSRAFVLKELLEPGMASMAERVRPARVFGELSPVRMVCDSARFTDKEVSVRVSTDYVIDKHIYITRCDVLTDDGTQWGRS